MLVVQCCQIPYMDNRGPSRLISRSSCNADFLSYNSAVGKYLSICPMFTRQEEFVTDFTNPRTRDVVASEQVPVTTVLLFGGGGQKEEGRWKRRVFASST